MCFDFERVRTLSKYAESC